jgi:hypothetical protein
MTIVVLALAGATVAAIAAPAAFAADSLQATRTLFLTERFTPTQARGALAGATQPHELVALQGETEGFQLALQNATGGALALHARIAPDANLAAALESGAIHSELLRVGMVNVRRASTGSRLGTGLFADPLPPFTNQPGGQLTVDTGRWGGATLVLGARTDAPAGQYAGSVELYSGDTVYARQPFTLDVRDLRTKRATDKGGFKTILGVEGEAYWLQHDDMRNRIGTSAADRALQLAGLMQFLDSRGVTPLELQMGNPATDGSYTCQNRYTRDGSGLSFAEQLNVRYFGMRQRLEPDAGQLRARVLPTHTWGCTIDSADGEFTGLVDPLRTRGVRQDDRLDPRAASFYRNVASEWKRNGWFTPTTYVKNPFDEPSDVTAAMRATMQREVPRANRTIRQALRGNGDAKIFLAAWPRQGGRTRVCARGARKAKGCINAKLDPYGNEHLWDNKGGDDPDIWMPSMTRIYGMLTTPKLRSDYGVNRDRIYADRLATIRKRHTGGGETWAYSYPTGTEQMPQNNIDSPGTDSRLQYVLLASEGITGLYMSNSMLGWGNPRAMQHNPSGTVRKGNPYRDVPYFEHRSYGIAAGWGTLIYPGYAPELGLSGEARRNTDAQPVTSLRMEGLRDGQEDANLIAMYRERFGDRATRAALAKVVPRSYRPLPKGLGDTTFVKYANAGMAQRMEAARRAMINRLAR